MCTVNSMSTVVVNLWLIHYFYAIDSQSTIMTPEYGGPGGAEYSDAVNQGRINAINDWGYNCCNLAIKDWTSDSQTVSRGYGYVSTGNGSRYTQCTPFQLSSSDFIVGYQVFYKDKVVGLDLYTRNGHHHSCIGPNANPSQSNITLYNTSADDFYYLSGWIIRSANIIDKIQLQFTKATSAPTNDPTTDPTIDPTSIPTSYPIGIPSINPTNDPTYPTIDPTIDPTMSPTCPKCICDTINPTASPALIPTIEESNQVKEFNDNESNVTSIVDGSEQIEITGNSVTLSFTTFLVIISGIIFVSCLPSMLGCYWLRIGRLQWKTGASAETMMVEHVQKTIDVKDETKLAEMDMMKIGGSKIELIQPEGDVEKDKQQTNMTSNCDDNTKDASLAENCTTPSGFDIIAMSQGENERTDNQEEEDEYSVHRESDSNGSEPFYDLFAIKKETSFYGVPKEQDETQQ